MSAHLENEDAVVAEARAGSHGAFTALVKQYDRHIYQITLSTSPGIPKMPRKPSRRAF